MFAASPEVIASFDSSSTVIMECFYNGNFNLGYTQRFMSQVPLDPAWVASGLQNIGTWPSDVCLFCEPYLPGTNQAYVFSYGNMLYSYRYPVLLSGLETGEEYGISIGSFFSKVPGVTVNRTVNVRVLARIYSANVLHDEILVFEDDFTPTSFVMQEFDDMLSGVFVAQATSHVLELVVEVRPTGGGGSGSAADPWWFGFVDARVIAPPSKDDLWQDEQRGFWQRVLDFLKGIMDAILSIGDFFANIGDWIIHLVVPTDEEVQEVVDQFMKFADQHLGFVSQMPQIFGRLLEAIKINSEGEDVIITLPKAYLPDAFGGETLWEDQEFNLTELVNSITPLKMFYGVYQVLASVLLFGLILRLFYKIAGRILGENVSAEDVSDKDNG